MSVSTKKLVYDFDRKYSVILSGKSKNIPLVDKIAYLNEFQQLLFNSCVREAERNQEASNEIRRFKRERTPLGLSVKDSVVYARYPSDFHTRLNQLVVVTEPTCCLDIEKELMISIVQSDDIHPARKNDLRKSSFPFERALSVISDNGLTLHVDNAFVVKSVLIDYYRKPTELHAPSLEECDGAHYYMYNGEIVNEDTDCEFENYADNFISDGAVLLASADKKDPEGFKLKLEKLLQSRNLYSVKD